MRTIAYIGKRPTRIRLERVLLWLVLPVLMASCGVYSFTGASIPPQAETISVDHFPNDAQLVQPILSQRFTEELQNIFIRQTNLRMVEGVGHLHFEGSITDYRTEPVAITGDDRAALNRLTITVRVSFFNTFDEDSEFQRTFSRYYDYDSNLSLSQVENQAIDRIVSELVEDIFNQSVVNW